MSPQDRPGDAAASPAATSADAASALIDEIVRRDAEVAARPPARPRGPVGSRILLIVLLSVLLVLSGWNAAQVIRARQPTAVEDEATARFTLYLVSQKVDDYRARNGDLPSSLEAARADEEEVTYRRSGDGYTLTITMGTHRFDYHSGEDWTPFLSGWELIVRRR
jgi:hypothetical protein